jgi:hypothetical protein
MGPSTFMQPSSRMIGKKIDVGCEIKSFYSTT